MLKLWKIGFVALLVGCGAQEATTPVVEKEVLPAIRYTLHGQVLDPWSTPVVGAEVRALPLGSDEAQAELARSKTDDAGHYELELELNGPAAVLLFARHEHAGFDRVESYALKPDALNEAPILYMAGEGRLAGRMTDAAGQPVAHAKVIAYSRDLLQQVLFRGSPALSLDALPLWAPRLEGAYFQPGRGFQYKEDETDESGRFAMKGLVPGDYLLYSPAIGGREWIDTGRKWSATGSEQIELRSTRCTLEVAVGQDGLPGTVAELAADLRRLGPIEVFATVPTKWGPRPLLSRAIEPYGLERNVFLLEPGDYIVRAVTFPPKGAWGGTMYVEGRVTLAPGETLKRLKLEFPDLETPTGRLRVQAVVPEGWDRPQRFHLLSHETARELECSEYTPYPTMTYGEWLDVPAGEYWIGLVPFDDFVGRSEVIEMAPSYRRIVVKAGEDVESTLHATFGGHFRLELDAERFVLGRDYVMPDDLSSGDQGAVLGLFAQTIGATVTVVRDDGGPALKLRLRDPLARIGRERKTMLPGEVFENFVPLEPGNYRLWADAPGFEVGSVPLTVKSRGRTELSLRLEPRAAN